MGKLKTELSVPKVSVIVPVYKVEKYLRRCVDSLLDQTLVDIEIILVDDGSPDNCPQICDDYSCEDDRVKVIHKANQGLGMARNTGLNNAIGKYVAFIDSDDYASRDLYKTLYERAESLNLDACFCDIYFVSQGRDPYLYSRESTELACRTKSEVMSFSLNLLSPRISQEYFVLYPNTAWNSIIKRERLLDCDVKFVSERKLVSEDVVFNLMWLPYANTIEWIPKPLIYHRIDNDSSLTNNLKFQKVEASIQMISKVHEILEKQYIGESMREEYFYSYSFKLINDICISIVRFVPSWLNKYKYMYHFLCEVGKEMPNKKYYYKKAHSTKKSIELTFFSKGYIIFSIIAFIMSVVNTSIKTRLYNVFKQ